MKIKHNLLLFLLLITIVCLECKKSLLKSRSSSSGRGSSRRTNSNNRPSPTSQSYSQSAQKPTLFGWQEKPAQRSQKTNTQQSRQSSHSYPSSQTGLSGNAPKQASPHQENVQKSSYPSQSQGTNTQQHNSHGYPQSNGMSGQPGTGAGYPVQQSGGGLSGNVPKQPQNSAYPTNQQSHSYPSNTGLSGAGAGYPSHQGAPPPYSGGGYGGHSNYGNNNHHPQGPPPPYQGNVGHGYGGYGGGYNTGYGSQMPGYFGNHGKGFGGMSRPGSALTGVGIAGAGVGTLLTGLALWNLARSTGNHKHTVIYDRGQPVAVAPADNSSSNSMDSLLGDLANCSLTISSRNATEVLAIPCAIATSFSPEADVKDNSGVGDNNEETTKCTVSVLTKTGKEYMTTIPCSILLNTAAENNVTEAPITFNSTNDFEFKNDTTGALPMNPILNTEKPSALPLAEGVGITNNNQSTGVSNCTLLEPGTDRDPINPCYAITHDVTVQPLLNENITDSLSANI